MLTRADLDGFLTETEHGPLATEAGESWIGPLFEAAPKLALACLRAREITASLVKGLDSGERLRRERFPTDDEYRELLRVLDAALRAARVEVPEP